ncbi:MAG: hypothetical protein FVQ77_15545 [Cytophagales bacterium]|nr:hypothetical protein [Cytophagales bacterium]
MKTKSLFFAVLMLMGVLAFTGCKKDPCEGVTCQNSGTCNEGTCKCPAGFSGTFCGTEVTPTTITLTKVVMDQFPPLDNGSDWDGALCGGANPDISIGLWNGSSYIYTSGTYSDVVPGTQKTYTLGLPITINNPTGTYAVDLFDDDTGVCAPDDYMGGLEFVPYTSGNGFPSTIRVDNLTAQIDVTLHVTYTW